MGRVIKPGDRAFYINRRNYAESESEIRIGVCGFFSGKAIHPEHGVMREFGVNDSNPNLLTNIGMDSIGAQAQFNRMHLGTGTTPPSITDTGLTNFGVNVANNAGSQTTGNSGSAPYYGWARVTWTSAVGAATGNWTEIGVSNQNTNGNLRSHALILDSNGDPTVFPVQADEQFQGTYEFRIYVPTDDFPGNITLSGTPYDIVARAIRATSTNSSASWIPDNQTNGGLFGSGGSARAYTGGLAAITASNPDGTLLGSGVIAQAAYSNGNYYRDISARWGSGQGVGTIRTLDVDQSRAQFQVEYTPTITKLTSEELIHNQRVSWVRR